MPQQNTMLNLRISVELKQQLEALANQHRRSLSDYLRLQLEQIADQHK